MQPIVVPKHVWVRLMNRLPAGHPLFGHDRCSGCQRWDGSLLSATAIHHVGMVYADAADPDGTSIFRGIATMARAAKRDRKTVIAATGHMLTVGLMERAGPQGRPALGGGRGLPRGKSSIYQLTVPDYEVLAIIGVDIAALMRSYEHLQQAPEHDWFSRAGI